MRILVVSDTHGYEYGIYRAIREQKEASLVIHLGDGLNDFDSVKKYFPKKQFKQVQGNNDGFRYKNEIILDYDIINGKTLFYTHGHRYNVKFGFDDVISAANEKGADILLFGHTHNPLIAYEDGLYIVNPGSLSSRSGTYATIDITKAGIVPNIVKLER